MTNGTPPPIADGHLAPAAIRGATFTPIADGYDPSEVTLFLTKLAADMEFFQAQVAHLRLENTDLREELIRLRVAAADAAEAAEAAEAARAEAAAEAAPAPAAPQLVPVSEAAGTVAVFERAQLIADELISEATARAEALEAAYRETLARVAHEQVQAMTAALSGEVARLQEPDAERSTRSA